MVLLLGDACYTDLAVERIVDGAKKPGIRWFGRTGHSYITGGCEEVFACTWDEENHDRVKRAFQASLDHAEADLDADRFRQDMRDKDGEEQAIKRARDKAGSPLGSVWQAYRWLEDIPLGVHAINRGGIWREINDFTDDFDTYESYLRWQERWKRRFICQGPVPPIDNFRPPVLET